MRVDEQTITLDEYGPVYFRSAPSSGPPPLYLHGVPTSSDDWLAVLERTGGIAPDLIGFGRSSKAGNLDYSLDGLATFVERLLEQAGVDRVSLVAHDWGAAVGALLAARRPERFEQLVLCNPLPLIDGLRWPTVARLWRRRLIGELVMGSTPRWLLLRSLRRACTQPGAWSEQRLAAVWDQFDQGTQRAILRLHRNTGERDLESVLPEIDRRALVVWGERDPWFSPALADEYVARLPQGRLERVGAGHWPWLDDPAVADRIAALVAR